MWDLWACVTYRPLEPARLAAVKEIQKNVKYFPVFRDSFNKHIAHIIHICTQERHPHCNPGRSGVSPGRWTCHRGVSFHHHVNSCPRACWATEKALNVKPKLFFTCNLVAAY